jgi:hypothetical protein
MTPHIDRRAETVQQYDHRAMPADAHMDRGAIRFDLTRPHTDREGVDAILTSVVVHHFTPGLKGTWL